MSRRRYHTPELARLLESAATPLYVLDAELRIVFVNEACRQWLGPAAEGLVGQQCVYHSGVGLSGPQAVAAGLCPPPGLSSGGEMTAEVSRPADQGGAEGDQVSRRGRFVPLGTRDGLLAVVAFLEVPEETPLGADLPTPPPVSPADEEDLPLRLHEHLRRLRREVVLSKGTGSQGTGSQGVACLVGSSPAARRARCQAELAAGSRASVLVVGPRGSGRRRLAEAIHYGANPESAGPILPLDCSLLDAESIRSVLRAVPEEKEDSPHLCEAPSGPFRQMGTVPFFRSQPAPASVLLLDADRLSAEIQAELAALALPAPAAHCSLPTAHCFRLLATAEAPLGDLVRRGRYREDLAAWLCTITIELPPLAGRRQDIPLLAQSLLEEGNARGGTQLAGFAPEALDRLDAYAWPGNIDELAQAVAESRQRAAGPLIAAADLPERLRLAAEAEGRPRRKEETVPLDEFVARIQRELIRRALARAKGNKAKAARLLGLNRPRLYRRMAQLGLLEEE
ncbi:MAG: helix-turn-helix domain-containing protein [Thermoguttaceae bacterium]|jgi:transcriptional regulator with AAA-type ATPase domain